VREYATLKAMGYTDGFLSSVVLQESLILAVFGFLPGLALALFLYRTVGEATQLPMAMTPERLAAVLVLTIAMCSLAAAMALRRVRRADPAEVF
jgi:putative ABC transport system permease protein